MQRHKAMLVSDVQLLAARRETAFALYFHTFQELKSRALQGAGPASVQHLWTEHHVELLKLKKLERVSQRTLQPISLSEKMFWPWVSLQACAHRSYCMQLSPLQQEQTPLGNLQSAHNVLFPVQNGDSTQIAQFPCTQETMEMDS